MDIKGQLYLYMTPKIDFTSVESLNAFICPKKCNIKKKKASRLKFCKKNIFSWDYDIQCYFTKKY